MTRPGRGRGRWLGAALALAAALTVVLAGPARAQQASAVEVTGIDLSDFPDVALRVAVAGATGELGETDFALTENDVAVEEVEVSPLTDQIISVLLAIDTSGSMEGEPLAQAKVAALRLLDELPSSARVGVVSFGDAASLVSSFTTNREATRAAVNDLEAGGGTALYDAIVLSTQQVAASDADRTALLVLTDGADSGDGSSIDAAIEAVTDVGDDVYAVSLETAETDSQSLTLLTEAGNGRLVPASDPTALEGVYVDLGQRIANQYQLVFTSTSPDPTATFAVTVGEDGPVGAVEIALPDRPDTAGDDGDDVPEERAAPTPLIGEAEPGPIEQGWVLYAGAGLVGLAIAITAVVVIPGSGGRREGRRRLASDRTAGDDAGLGERTMSSVRDAATRLSSAAVERTHSTNTLDHALDRAGLVMRAGEFVAASAALALAAGTLAFLLFGPVLGLVGLLVPVLGANAFLKFRARRRNARFADQLSDALLVMSGALRSGFGVGQAIDTVAEEMDAPLAVEFQRALLETRLGRDMEDALEGVARRVQNEDFEWVVDAMRINRQVGGDLAAILDQVSETIRARNRLKRQVAALTAEGRVSAYVLSFLPVGLGLVLYSSNPDYLDPLFDRTPGRIMLGFAILLLVSGGLWLRKMIDIEY